jgi:hypothetical protein
MQQASDKRPAVLQKSVSVEPRRARRRYPASRMRVIGRVLLGTLAIVFAVVFLARLVSRPKRHGRRHAHPNLPRALPAPARSSHHVRPGGYLAAQPGGSGWGRLVVPPSSPSRALRRKGKRRALSAARSLRLARRKRFSSAPVSRLQKTVVAMNYGMLEKARGKQHGVREIARLNRALPRRLRFGTSRRAHGAKAVGWLADAAGAGAAASAGGFGRATGAVSAEHDCFVGRHAA